MIPQSAQINSDEAAHRHTKSLKKLGFTLIELLSVIAVVGILFSILIVGIGRVRYAAKKVVSTSTLRSYHSAMMMHVNEKQSLPGPLWAGQPPVYTGSLNYLATHLWPYFQDSEPPAQTIPEWLNTPQFTDWYEGQTSKDGKFAYMLPLEADTLDGSRIPIYGYPDTDLELEQSNYNRLLSATKPAEVLIMYESAATSRAPNRSPKPGEIQNHLANLYLDGHVDTVDY